MQHDQPKVTTLRKAERTRSARTPDRSDIRHLDATMVNTFSPKRKVHTSRLSMMPPSLNASTLNLRKAEMENNPSLELELAYSEYVSSYAELLLEKKNLKDTEVSFTKSINSLQEEVWSLQEKCKLIETRISDIKALSCINDYADIVQINIKHFIDMQKKYEIKSIVRQLEKLLSRFNILRCENITLPSNEADIQEFKKKLTECCAVLQQISDPTECNAFENVATNYEEFITMFQEIYNAKKIIEERIYNIQSEILKKCSLDLVENDV